MAYSKIYVFKVDDNDKIIITLDELQEALDKAYSSGYEDGKNAAPITPSWPYDPLYPVKYDYYPPITTTSETITTGRDNDFWMAGGKI